MLKTLTAPILYMQLALRAFHLIDDHNHTMDGNQPPVAKLRRQQRLKNRRCMPDSCRA